MMYLQSMCYYILRYILYTLYMMITIMYNVSNIFSTGHPDFAARSHNTAKKFVIIWLNRTDFIMTHTDNTQSAKIKTIVR